MPTRRNFTAGLTAASARLREVNSPDLAAHVDEALAVLEGEIVTARKDEKLPIRLPITARDRIVAGAAEANRTVTADVNEAFTRFLAGEFTLNQPVRARRGVAEDKVNLNVRANKTLMEQVAATGVLPMHVAADWLMRKYETGPYAAGQNTLLPAGSTRNPQIPRPVRDLIRARVAEAGKNVNTEIEEAFTRFLAGDFTPVAPVWPKGADMVPFKVSPNNDLFEQVKEKAEGITPMQVALAYLLAEYDIAPDTAAE
ncbi:hypothetical protein ACFVS9_28070 [Streptomyces sp. NPDC058008]|uniref:hypothetical protein n=1 Tax=Streptomyces sp. NPDC058008 TaxID=3346303 RepID=UPI0036F12040